MLTRFSEKAKSNLGGTIVDIETIGDFCYDYDDSRHYHKLRPTAFGHIDKDGLNIICARGTNGIEALKEEIKRTLPDLRSPLFAFNCCFEQGVLFHSCETKISFQGELNGEKFESKKKTVASLGIRNYDDPFNDNGLRCAQAWLNGQYELVIKHNRSCLLKERDILLTRRYREPDPLELCSF
jgi:hypothetical protein